MALKRNETGSNRVTDKFCISISKIWSRTKLFYLSESDYSKEGDMISDIY